MHTSCINLEARRSEVRVNFFSCRFINVWNSLPDSVIFVSLQAFKRVVLQMLS